MGFRALLTLKAGPICCTLLAGSLCAWPTLAQDSTPPAEQAPSPEPVLKHRSSAAPAAPAASASAQAVTIPLTLPTGTAVQVVLDRDVRVKTEGQPIRARVVQAVYAFDQIVIPVNTQALGKISEIQGVPGLQRTLAALNADFTPTRKVAVEFNELILPDGKQIAIRTTVTPGSGQVIQFVTAKEENSKQGGVQGAAAAKARQAKMEAKRQWEEAMKQVKQPGKMQRVKKYLLAQLPMRPQWIDAGTLYFAELKDPLEFGSEPFTPEMAAAIGGPTPPGSVVHARLLTALDSSSSKKGDAVEAELTQPLLDGKHLVLPQASRLKGTLVQVKAARRLKRNGELRMVFHEVAPPDGLEQRVEASLEGLQAGRNENVKLDTEGGAKPSTPKTRYLTTGIAVGLAMASQGGDRDAAGGAGSQGGKSVNRIAGGAVGFKLIGIVLGAAVHSRAFGAAMGAYGAAMSVYGNFLSRGRNMVFPRNTGMMVSIGPRAAPQGASETNAPANPQKE